MGRGTLSTFSTERSGIFGRRDSEGVIVVEGEEDLRLLDYYMVGVESGATITRKETIMRTRERN